LNDRRGLQGLMVWVDEPTLNESMYTILGLLRFLLVLVLLGIFNIAHYFFCFCFGFYLQICPKGNFKFKIFIRSHEIYHNNCIVSLSWNNTPPHARARV